MYERFHYDPGQISEKRSIFRFIQIINIDLKDEEKQSCEHPAREERDLQGCTNQIALEVELPCDRSDDEAWSS